MNQIFDYNGSKVRTVIINGKPWFVLRDICNILDLSTPSRVAERLKADDVSLAHIIDSMGRKQETTVVNESGLYKVIMRSDKPEAEPFQDWVTDEVLPAIRKHGVYMSPEAIEKTLYNPDFIIGLAQELKSEREQRIALEGKVEKQRPQVAFANSVDASSTSILVGEQAKLLKQNGADTGERRLYQWLRDNKYLISRKGNDYNMPTQRSMELALFEIKETVISHADGRITIRKTPMVTGKGQIYFTNKFIQLGLAGDKARIVNNA